MRVSQYAVMIVIGSLLFMGAGCQQTKNEETSNNIAPVNNEAAASINARGDNEVTPPDKLKTVEERQTEIKELFRGL